jgi:hypothetical protein
MGQSGDMKLFDGLILLGLICTIPLSIANEGAVSGNIIDVDWPDQDIGASATLVPWVIIENTGAPTSFNIKFSIQGPNDKWYQGACSSTAVLEHGEKKTVWPSSVQISSSMPKGAYNAKVELFADYCSTDKLDTMTKDYAFI